jgi:hypothetical protein
MAVIILFRLKIIRTCDLFLRWLCVTRVYFVQKIIRVGHVRVISVTASAISKRVCCFEKRALLLRLQST